ncbi:MAG: hypothetical protein LBT40_14165, partial [Deltaproteobacteria bacterium]|nr:hypothetical protein [Deltaproteobacteria bacterium]
SDGPAAGPGSGSIVTTGLGTALAVILAGFCRASKGLALGRGRQNRAFAGNGHAPERTLTGGGEPAWTVT